MRTRNKNKLFAVMIIMLLSASVASASIIDDAGSWLNSAVKTITDSARTLSIPGIGTTTVSCADGSTTCKYYGDNWHITTDILSSNQNLQITLPSGTTWTDQATNIKATSGSMVTLTIKPGQAEIIKKIQPMTQTYIVCSYVVICNTYPVPGYQPSGATSFKRIYYDVELKSQGMTYTKSVPYDYVNQQAVFLTDNKGNEARLTPRYVISTGYDIELSNVIYMDNGYGTYRPYSYNTFIIAYPLVKGGQGIPGQAPPRTWLEYINVLKYAGLKEITDIGNPQLGSSKTEVQVIYPGGNVGIVGELLIPKDMASTVTVQMNDGDPVIDKIDLQPPEFTIGQGAVMVTVYVTNKGGDDWFQMGIDQQIGNTNYISNRKWILAGKSDYFQAQVFPTVTTAQTSGITATVTAMGSFKPSSKTALLTIKAAPQDCGLFGCADKTQKVKVTAYNPDKQILGNAPIFKNGVQVSSNGYYESDLPLGKYTFSSDNSGNPTLYTPVPVSVDLTGGEPKIVSLFFSGTPQQDDYTWVFWILTALIVIVIIFSTGYHKVLLSNPMYIVILIVLLVILWVLYELLKVMLGIASGISNAWNAVTTLGGILK